MSAPPFAPVACVVAIPEERGFVNAFEGGAHLVFANAEYAWDYWEGDPTVDAVLIPGTLAEYERLVQDAERYRFLRDNRLGLRAVDGNASLHEQPRVRTHLDDYVDAVIGNPEYIDDPTRACVAQTEEG